MFAVLGISECMLLHVQGPAIRFSYYIAKMHRCSGGSERILPIYCHVFTNHWLRKPVLCTPSLSFSISLLTPDITNTRWKVYNEVYNVIPVRRRVRRQTAGARRERKRTCVRVDAPGL